MLITRKRTAVTIGLAAVLLGSGITPAHADWTANVSGGYGYVRTSKTRVGACDTSGNNWGVRTFYVTSNGVSDSVGDWNGSSSGCGEEGPSGGGTIVKFRVCTGPGSENRQCNPSTTGWIQL
ncbi:hypothetical protein [Actinomadura rudentiformis]|uniref:Secreted protein n=1 Tax=Actinomadura rudentiformis TaxID=359158 RepID=A0A6H9Z2E1_9ACTN|nr:hypothetical protein [Actinomadura rudentiformis]KAB2352192.1 hypothetical protein F8566_00280 [Actinomadura rudentiformis]